MKCIVSSNYFKERSRMITMMMMTMSKPTVITRINNIFKSRYIVYLLPPKFQQSPLYMECVKIQRSGIQPFVVSQRATIPLPWQWSPPLIYHLFSDYHSLDALIHTYTYTSRCLHLYHDVVAYISFLYKSCRKILTLAIPFIY